MQTERDRSLAEEWLPSRFHLAVFRMLGLLVALASRGRPSSAIVLQHDREQHPLEAYALSCALLAVPSLHFFVAIAPRLRWPWLTGPLVILALPFAMTLAWDIVVFSVALVTLVVRSLTGLDIQAITLQGPVIHGLMLALSAASVALGWRTAWLGGAWLGLVVLNALCAGVLWAARDRVAKFAREVSCEA